MTKISIGIACDHAGYDFKEKLKNELEKKITEIEALNLEKQEKTAKINKVLLFELSSFDDLKNYIKYYKYYPQYHEGIL